MATDYSRRMTIAEAVQPTPDAALPELAGLHILILAPRDWGHPQAGGAGEHVRVHVERWVGWGARVSIVSGGWPGGPRREEGPGWSLRRLGTDMTVVAHVVARGLAGRMPAADIVLECISGVFFLTPLWRPRMPRVVWFHHVHRAQYRTQYGPVIGPAAEMMLETGPTRTLYRNARFMTPSRAIARELTGIHPRARVTTNYEGLDHGDLMPGKKAAEPTLLYLGRLRRYKRVDLLLDVVERLHGVRLEVAGDGDDADRVATEVARRNLGDRVRLHGFVDDAARVRLFQEAWLHVTASAAEGWGLTVLEAGACATPTAALAVGGLTEAIRDGETGMLAHNVEQLTENIRLLLADSDLRRRMGDAAVRWAHSLSWTATARRTAEALLAERAGGDAT
jgi:glycosyltransferase involved in cell wall biosynthesis